MQTWTAFLDQFGYAPNAYPATFYDTSLKTDSSYEAGGVGGEKVFASSEITVGGGNAISVLSGTDPTYRLWIGNPDPALASFKVTKNGDLIVDAFEIGNGNIVLTNGANGIELKNTIPVSFWDHTNSGANFAGQIYASASDYLTFESPTGNGFKFLNALDVNDNNINNIGTLNFFGHGAITWNGGASRLTIDAGTGNQIRPLQDLDGNSTVSLNAWKDIFCRDVNGRNSNFSGTKSAVVPSSRGMIKVFSGEAPESWFFDFADSKDTIDPLFLEVTSGEMQTLRTEEGKLLVFRKRKNTDKFTNERFPLFEEE
jgi:hypothetical protein